MKIVRSFQKNSPPLRANKGPAIPMGGSPTRLFRWRGTRSSRLVLVAVLALSFFVTQQALNASTRRAQSSSDYLTWLLRDESARPKPEKRTVPGAVAMASLTKRLDTRGDGSLRIDFGTMRATIEQVQGGDTIFSVLQRHGVARKTARDAARAGIAVTKRYKLGNVTRPFQLGKLLKLAFDQENHLTALHYPIDDTRTLSVNRQADGHFTAEIRKMPLGATMAKEVASTKEEATPASEIPTKKDARLRVQDLFSGAARQTHDTVRSGDLLTTLLARHGVSQATAYQVAAASKPLFNLARLMKPGNDFRLAMDKKGQLMGIAYSINADTLLWVMRQGDTARFQPHLQKKQFETRLTQVSGTIDEDGSLFLAGKAAGLSHTMVSKLANLFEWDIDFTRDIHAGDQFRIVYEGKYYRGRYTRDGEIVAAEFINQGRTLQVFRYADPKGTVGYYDAKGQSIRKMFIRAPVDFTRITSLFSKQRKHPIYGFDRAHKGVDYAAPTGTPVRAAADGRVTFVGTKGDYGQMITLRHNDTYSTAYAHLSGFGRGLRVGTHVKQGEVIGRVGTTGASTGPHLHYEVRIHDNQVNPLSIQQVTAEPITSRHAEDFRLQVSRLLALLRTENTRVAALSTSDETDN